MSGKNLLVLDPHEQMPFSKGLERDEQDFMQQHLLDIKFNPWRRQSTFPCQSSLAWDDT